MKRVLLRQGKEYVTASGDVKFPEELIREILFTSIPAGNRNRKELPDSVELETSSPGDWEFKMVSSGNFAMTVLSFEDSVSFYPAVFPLPFGSYRIVLREDRD